MSDYNRNEVLKILKYEKSKETFYGNHMKAAFNMSIDAIEKLAKIEQIVKRAESLHPEIAIVDREAISRISEVLKA